MGLSATVTARGMQPITATASVSSRRLCWAQTRKGDVAQMLSRAQQFAAILNEPQPRWPGGFHNYLTSAQTTASAITADIASSIKVSISHGMSILVDAKEPSGMTWAQVGAGQADAWLTALLTQLDALGVPVILSLHNEPFGDSQGTAATWGQMFARCRLLMTQLGTKHISLTALLQVEPFDHTDGDSQNDPRPYLLAVAPYIDLWGMNGYNHWSVGKPASKWYTQDQVFGYVYAAMMAIDPSKGVVIGEWGVRTDPANPGRAAQWMRDFYQWCLAHGVVFAAFFDSDANVNDNGSPWTLDWTGDGTDGQERLVAQAQLYALAA